MNITQKLTFTGMASVRKTIRSLGIRATVMFQELLVFLFLGLAFTGLSMPLSGQTTITYTTPGADSFTVPAGVTEITVELWGAGGAGGGGSTAFFGLQVRSGGGGGGGAYLRTVSVAVTPGQTYNLFVGAGGSSNGQSGASSTATFGAVTLTAAGGNGGTSSS
ncbi:MAG: hypothetical protein RG741_11105 [Bacteroidales bacterium]|nr:hypothetical protein [Bacteroidales bacterium]